MERIEPAEEEVLRTSPCVDSSPRRSSAWDRRRLRKSAVERIQGKGYECVLHFDVDVIADFQATNNPGTGGLSLEAVHEALEVFTRQKHLAAIEVAAYNPLKDADGKGAKLIIDLLADVLEKRLRALEEESPSVPTKSAPPAQSASEASAESDSLPSVASGEAWSSDELDASFEAKSSEPEENETQSTNPEDTGDSAA